MSDIVIKIRAFVIENFLYGDGSYLQDNTSFIDDGIIDSTGILELVDFIESQFGISMSDDEMIPENMDSIKKVAAYLDKKTMNIVDENYVGK
jgi:acyl carrier protein